MDELPIRSGDDVVRVRQQVRTAAAENGLSLVDQTKLVTAASELARNTLVHGGGGTALVEVVKSPNGRKGVKLHFTDELPYQRIGAVLGVTPTRVCQLLWRAIDRLRVQLARQ